MISSLPGKALRTLVDIARLAEPGKVDIQRRAPGILFISLQVYSLFKLAIMTSLSIFVFSVISDVIQKVQRHHDLIKAHAVR